MCPQAASTGSVLGGRTHSPLHSLAKSIDRICLSRDVVFWHNEHECLDGKNVSGRVRQ